MLSFQKLALQLCACLLIVQTYAAYDFNYYKRYQEHRAQNAAENVHAQQPLLESRKDISRYYNDKTAPYFIESWPDVNFDTGEFYSGSVRAEVYRALPVFDNVGILI